MAKQSDSVKILDTVQLKDGTKVKLNDFIYMRAEIPFEPFYVGRVMEFIPHPKYPKELQVRVAWFYRPKDVFLGRRKHYDPRLLVATMHSDLNPVSSIRGLCSIMHEAHIDGHALEEYKRENDHFYYSQLYDRYCRASYDVVPCANVRNVPGDVAKALQERFEYILVEAGMAGEFTEAHRVCKHCSKWAASTDSLRCAVCTSSYHMACLDPPLTKKPTKGYAWQCAVCLRSQKKAKELENSFLQLGDRGAKTAASAAVKLDGNGKLITASNEAPGENETTSSERENITAIDEPDTSITADAALSPARPSMAKRSKGNLQTSESQKWPFRYFGIHTHVNDVFDYDARINPRAASRIGNKYQCNIPAFNSELPVAVPPTIAKTPICSTTASSSTSPVAHRAHSLRLGETTETDSETVAVVPKPGRGRPRKIPIGGVSVSVKRKDAPEEAGSRDSVVLQRGFDPPVFDWPKNQPGATLDSYIMAVREQTRSFPCPPHSADLLDRALFVLAENEYNTEAALKIMEKVEHEDLGISFIEWSETEKTKFEDCMMSWGHDLVGAKNYVPEKKSQEIVRYFYSWKKSDRYLPVYGAYAKKFKPNKKFKIRGVPLDPKTGQPMDANSTTTEEEDDDDDDDENAPLPDDGTVRVCSNCATNQSPIWRTAPPAHMLGETVVSHVAPHGRSGITKGAAKTLMENDTEGAVKTFCDECSIFWLKYGFLRVLPSKKKEDGRRKDVRDAKAGIPSTEVRQKRTYTKRKKLDVDDDSSLHSPVPVRFKKITGPCDVCQTMEQRHGQHLILCNHCGLTVHVECYGISEASLISSAGKRWACDPCRNSAGPTALTDYSCVLCTPSKRSIQTEPLLCNQFNSDDVIATHRALGDSTAPLQAASAISVLNLTKPRALKKTIGNNWAHVLCSAWIPEVKFGDVEIMEPVESIGLIPGWMWKETCCICNLPGGACISCADQCGKHFHVACAIAARYTIGFQTNDGGKGFKSHANYADGLSEKPITAFMVSSSTSLSPRVWCSDHALKGKKVLRISDLVEDGDRIRTTLAYYIRHYKKCDSFGTGAMRKARFVNTVTGGKGGGGQRCPIIIWSSKSGKRLASASAPLIVHCVSCGVDASPFWWDVRGSSKALDRLNEVNKERDVEMEERDPGRENGGKVCHRCHSNRLLAEVKPTEQLQR